MKCSTIGMFSQRHRRWPYAVLALITALLGSARLAGAHGEQIATGGGGGGPVKLSAEQREAIGLQTEAADFHDIDTVLPLNAFVAHDPNRHVFVSTRIEGKVETIFVNVGDRVTRDQKLAVIQSRQIGNPPPTITITAPMAGVVDERLVAPGEAIEPNKPVFHIADLSQVIVLAEAYEEDVAKITLGQEARVHAFAYPGASFTGTVSFLGQQLDPEKRTLPVWITVANPDSRLKPGMSATAIVVLKRSSGSLSIPTAAVIDAGGERFVFVDSGGTLTRADVRTGAADDRFVEILDGLVPGDLVVTQGTRQVYTTWLTGGSAPAGEPD